MARNFEVIKTEILTNIASNSVLSGLTNSSLNAVFREMVNVFAFTSYVLEVFYDNFTATITGILASDKKFSKGWYNKQALLFQDGDEIVVTSDYEVYYPVFDATKQIVKYCAEKEQDFGGGLYGLGLKVHKESAKLTANELIRFNAYIQKIKPAGLYVSCTSVDADRLVLNIVVNYFSENVQATIIQAVKDSVTAYINSIGFGGEFIYADFIAKITATTGVRDISVSVCNIINANGTFSAFSRVELLAGRSNMDFATDYTATYNAV